MRDFGHTAGGDEAELLLWLHDARRAQPLSERFRVRIARDGFSNYVDRLHANSTLFAVSKMQLDPSSIYHINTGRVSNILYEHVYVPYFVLALCS